MAGVFQIRGKENILQAYENSNVEIWAIFVGRNLITKGKGGADLSAFLDLVTNNGSNGVYTLKTYEDLKEPKQVKEKTEASGSLNFILNPEDFTAVGSFRTYPGEPGGQSSLYKEVQELKQKLAELQQPEERRPTISEAFEEAAIGFIQDPGQLVSLFGMIKDLFKGKQTQTNYPQITAAAVGNIPQDITNDNENDGLMTLTEDQAQRLSAALDILGAKDKKIVDHLEKLAKMAKESPMQFKMMLTMLDGMK